MHHVVVLFLHPFFFFLDLVSAASLRLQRNIKLYMLDVLTLCYLQ